MTPPLAQPDDYPLPRLPERRPESHKGHFGLAMLLGGSRDMSGAISLAGMAALRSGAGLVRLAVPRPIQPIVAGHEPSYMTVPLAADDQGRLTAVFTNEAPSPAGENPEGSSPAGTAAASPVSGEVDLTQLLQKATAVGCGPGMGRSATLDRLVGWLYQHVTQPAVFDADALNALSVQPDVLTSHAGPRVLTPHPGEFARLLNCSTDEIAAQRQPLAEQFARRTAAIVVLKGHRTLVTDGTRTVANTTGNPGMATGGTGDVLTGILTALLAQGVAPFDAARLAVYLHGLAGDLAAERLGMISMTATDLLFTLPHAFRQLAAQQQQSAAPS